MNCAFHENKNRAVVSICANSNQDGGTAGDRSGQLDADGCVY
jgi:hypothetical protein